MRPISIATTISANMATSASPPAIKAKPSCPRLRLGLGLIRMCRSFLFVMNAGCVGGDAPLPVGSLAPLVAERLRAREATGAGTHGTEETGQGARHTDCHGQTVGRS